MRANGFYHVKWKNECWDIAEYRDGDWIAMGMDYCGDIKDSDIVEIDETPIVRGQAYTKNELDFIYCAGVLNAAGMDGLRKELDRLKDIGKCPHDIIVEARKQKEIRQ